VTSVPVWLSVDLPHRRAAVSNARVKARRQRVVLGFEEAFQKRMLWSYSKGMSRCSRMGRPWRISFLVPLAISVASCCAPEHRPEQDVGRPQLHSSVAGDAEAAPAMPSRLADDLSSRVRPRTPGDDLEECPFLPLRLGIVDVFERPNDHWRWAGLTTIEFEYQFVLPMPVHSMLPDYGLYAHPIQ